MKEVSVLPTYFLWDGLYWKLSYDKRSYHGYASLYDYQLNSNTHRLVDKSKLYNEITSHKNPYVIQLPENFKHLCIKKY